MTYSGVGLVEYAKSNIGNPYIYGTFGQIGNSKLLSAKHSQYPNYVTAKRVEIVKANPDKYFRKPWHDCSGLVKGYLMRKNLTVVYNSKYDLSANGFINAAKEKGTIGTIPEIVGLGLWRNNHLGVYIGGGRCVQAKGFDYGVIESDLSGFTHWCKLPFIEYGAEVPPPVPSEEDVWHSITCLATTKAFEDTLGWRHGEGTRLFMVKRTEPPEVGSLLFEGDITANNIFYFGSLEYSVNSFFWNHFSS